MTPNFALNEVTVLLGDSQGTTVNSAAVAPVAFGTKPVVADINGDGIDDVLIQRQDGAVLYRRGTRIASHVAAQTTAQSLGEFGTAVVLNPQNPARDFTLLRTPSGLQIATLDVTGNAVSLYQYDPSATLAQRPFRQRPSVPISGSIPARIASGNFDHDSAGRDDFALINQGTQTVSLYLAGESGFQLTETFDAGAGPVSLTTADFHRDGLTDLVVPNFGSGDVSVFTNSGDGDFTTSLFRTGPGPYFIGPLPFDPSRIESQSFDQTSSAEVGDFNRDGLPDVIAANPGSNSYSILYGTSRGLSSQPQITLLGSSNSRFAVVRVADVNHDDFDDAVFLNESGMQLSVYLNSTGVADHPRLKLTSTIDLPTALTGLTLHDANGDSLPDVFATNEFGDLLLMINQGWGEFAEYRRADRRVPIAVQDLNGDGKADVVLANQSLDQVSIDFGGMRTPSELESVATRQDGVVAPGAVKLVDLDLDNVDDLIVANTGGNSVLIYKGVRVTDATGLSRVDYPHSESIFTGSNPASVTVNDLNQDGRLDLVVANRGSNSVAVFYGQSDVDAQTIPGTTAIPFRAGALSKLPSGSGPVDVQVVSLRNDDGTMMQGLVVTNSTSNSVSFIPSAGNGIFNQTPSNTVLLGFQPLPGPIVDGNLVLPNPGGNSLGFVSISTTNFSPGGQPAISFSPATFELLNGIASGDMNGDGIADLFVNSNGSISLLMGNGTDFDFTGTFSLERIAHFSDMQIFDGDLYVTEEGRDIFTVFDLADLRRENGDEILDFAEISRDVSTTVADTNRPTNGLGLFSPLLLALFGQFPSEDGEARGEASVSDEPAIWQSLVLFISQVTQQIERISGALGDALRVSLLESLSADLGLLKLTNTQISQVTWETLVTPLSMLPGSQPLTQLVRGLRSLWHNRPNAPIKRPADSSTSPSAKSPSKLPMKSAPAQSSAIPRDGKASESATAVPTGPTASPLISAVSTSNAVQPSGIVKYMTQLATNSTVAGELFDHRLTSPQEVSMKPAEDHFGTEAATVWRAIALSALVSPTMTEVCPRRLRNRRSLNMTVG